MLQKMASRVVVDSETGSKVFFFVLPALLLVAAV